LGGNVGERLKCVQSYYSATLMSAACEQPTTLSLSQSVCCLSTGPVCCQPKIEWRNERTGTAPVPRDGQ